MRAALPDEIRSFSCNLALTAGAGAGKTAALVEFYLGLIQGAISPLGPCSCLEILALTFTEKAAQEMRERIRQGLLGLLGQSEDRERLRLADELKRLEGAPINTIHGFCAGLLREFAVEAGLDPDFGLIEGRAMLEEAAWEVVVRLLDQGDPDLEVLAASLPFEDRFGLLSGLIDALALARSMGFSAAHMKNELARVPHELPRLKAEVEGRYVEALVELSRVGLNPKNKSTARYEELIQAGPGALGEGRIAWISQRLKGHSPRDAALVIAELKQVVDKWTGLSAEGQAALVAESLIRVTEKIEAAYWQAKQARSWLDFDDLQILVRDILFERPDLRQRVKERLKAILVDESQDTNPIQWQIINCLCESLEQSTPLTLTQNLTAALKLDWRKLLVVGDPKQSIYRFRGAEVADFSEIIEHFGENAAGRVHCLTRNYRSQPGLVEFFNRFFARHFGPAQEPWQAAYDQRDRQDCHRRGSSQGLVELLVTPLGSSAAERRELEAAAVAWRIKGLVAEGFEHRDIAILLRRLTQVAPLLWALRRLEVPYDLVKASGGLDEPEVQDLINLLEYLTRPDDIFLLAALLRSPLVLLSDEALFVLVAAGGLERFVGPRVSKPPAGLAADEVFRLTRFNELINDLLSRRDHVTPPELLELAVERSDLTAVVAAGFQGRPKMANVKAFIEKTRQLYNGQALSLIDLVNLLRPDQLGRAADLELPSLEGEEAVRVMTIHQAKGLQFRVVIVAQSGERPGRPYWPTILFRPGLGLSLRIRGPEGLREPLTYRRLKEMEQAREEAEDKRLFYVAATRARDRLIFSGRRHSESDEASWRAAVERFAVAGPAGLVCEKQGRVDLPPPSSPLQRPHPKPDPKTMAAAGRIVAQVFEPPPTAKQVSISVSELEDLHQCPRLYWRRRLLLEEPSAQDLGGEWSGLDSIAKGVWLHKVLEIIDFARPKDLSALVHDAAGALGLWPTKEEVDFITQRLKALLKHDLGSLLRGLPPHQLSREAPLSLRVEAKEGWVQVRGEIDLLALTKDGLWLIDYKLAEPSATDYSFQLQIYGLAALKALAQRPALKVVYLHRAGVTEKDIPFGADQENEVMNRLTGLAAKLIAAEIRPETRLDPEFWPARPQGPTQTCPFFREGRCCA